MNAKKSFNGYAVKDATTVAWTALNSGVHAEMMAWTTVYGGVHATTKA